MFTLLNGHSRAASVRSTLVNSFSSPSLQVKNTLEVSDTVIFSYGNFHFTSCLCGVSTRRFFWEIEAPGK